jgi:hypothetical protein
MAKELDEEIIEQIELILDIQFPDIQSSHQQELIKILYEKYKELINGI